MTFQEKPGQIDQPTTAANPSIAPGVSRPKAKRSQPLTAYELAEERRRLGRRHAINDQGLAAKARAHEYAARGWKVMPGFVKDGKKIPFGTWDLVSSCPKEIDSFGGAWNGGLIFTPTVKEFVTLDIDRKNGKDGFLDLAELEKEHGAAPKSWRWRTPSAGEQIMFATGGHRIRKSVGELGRRDSANPSGLDVIADRAMTVLPGSIRPDGPVEWIDGHSPSDCELAVLPDWLCREMLEARGLATSSAVAAPSSQPEPAAPSGADANADATATLGNPENRFDATASNSPKKLARLESALVAVPYTDHDQWVRVVAGLHSYSGGAEASPGIELADAWSRGDAARGFAGTGAAYDPTELRHLWDSLTVNKAHGVTVATIYYLAKQNGWDHTLKRHGLSGRDFSIERVSSNGQLVLDAAAALPRGNLLHQALLAIRAYACWKFRKAGASKIAVLDFICSHINTDLGFAWVSQVTIAGHFSMTHDGVNKIINELRDEGLIAWNRRDEYGASGRIETTWGVTPPDGFSWSTLIEWRRASLNHTPDTIRQGLGELQDQLVSIADDAPSTQAGRNTGLASGYQSGVSDVRDSGLVSQYQTAASVGGGETTDWHPDTSHYSLIEFHDDDDEDIEEKGAGSSTYTAAMPKHIRIPTCDQILDANATQSTQAVAATQHATARVAADHAAAGGTQRYLH